MHILLLVYLFSSGLHSERFADLKSCRDQLMAYRILAKGDLWSGTCAEDDEPWINVLFAETSQ